MRDRGVLTKPVVHQLIHNESRKIVNCQGETATCAPMFASAMHPRPAIMHKSIDISHACRALIELTGEKTSHCAGIVNG